MGERLVAWNCRRSLSGRPGVIVNAVMSDSREELSCGVFLARLLARSSSLLDSGCILSLDQLLQFVPGIAS